MVGLVGFILFSSLSFVLVVNIVENDVVIYGYDLVVYFIQYKVVVGVVKYMVIYEGVIYCFSSVKNCDMFKVNVVKYVLQFGGYCVMGVVFNKKLDVDFDVFYIKDDKLYFNFNKVVQKKWLEDVLVNLKIVYWVWDGIEILLVVDVNVEE